VLPNANRIPTVTASRHHPNAPNHFPTGSGCLNIFFLRVFAPSRETKFDTLSNLVIILTPFVFFVVEKSAGNR
jgi:hypothetical protein